MMEEYYSPRLTCIASDHIPGRGDILHGAVGIGSASMASHFGSALSSTLRKVPRFSVSTLD